MHIGGVFVCGCGRARMSLENLLLHHDDVRVELAQLGLKRARASVQTITLAEIADAYRKAGAE
jgi:hypothetical protein